MPDLDESEASMVAVVRDFVNREVRPKVRDLEQSDTYPEQLIERMKSLGIFRPRGAGAVGRSGSVGALLRRRHRGVGPAAG